MHPVEIHRCPLKVKNGDSSLFPNPQSIICLRAAGKLQSNASYSKGLHDNTG
jgi:hypothetical protein